MHILTAKIPIAGCLNAQHARQRLTQASRQLVSNRALLGQPRANRSFQTLDKARPSVICGSAQNEPSNEVYVEDEGFDLSKVSFGSIAAPIGIALLLYGFGAYISLLPGSDISALLLIYGFPISLIGLALKYAELKPVDCKSTEAALQLRPTQMTAIQKQVREDTTRYRYGDEQHLDEALARIFKFGRPDGLPRRQAPTLVGLREEVVEGAYALVLEFESEKMPQDAWEKFQPKIQSFFGPGIYATLTPTDKGMDVALVSDGSGEGRQGLEQKDVLPPLVPGLKPRSQK
mmetsp:Transcript_502/g.1093  ORF Transcript_502/g.1093 Transcript_502/m.1093 type:complete len:289 (+) Transcript_502:82-948(+)